MDKSQIIHDLTVAAAVVSVFHNYDSEVMSERLENRREQLGDCIKDEYEWYLSYFCETVR